MSGVSTAQTGMGQMTGVRSQAVAYGAAIAMLTERTMSLVFSRGNK